MSGQREHLESNRPTAKRRNLMEVQEQSNVDLFKESARRMTEFFASKGVKVKNTIALEALSTALGAKNYRTLLASLNRPAATRAEEDPNAWKPGQPRYTVHALYEDNNQRYSDDFGGADALEAAVCCQVDRNADFCSVTIASVIDRVTGKIADTGWCGDDEIGKHGAAVRAMLDVAKGVLRQDTKVPEDVAAAFLYLNVQVDGTSTELIDEMSPGEGDIKERKPVTLKAYGLEHVVEPVEALETVARYILDCVHVHGWVKLTNEELRSVYHASALTRYFEYELRGALFDENELEILDEALPAGNLAGHPMAPVTWLAIANDEQVFAQGTHYTVAGSTPA
ncbi:MULTISPECIES: glyoxalase superfamily protein [unclassified Variovorax]|uniref:glyoxalase superfamily protein n=1 Tax=unclassified Variovorax TaxID=663243 RepID=UPI0011AECDD6|nr:MULTISPECIES: glyoxalase superfamily protein [unclassified Variovorax]